MKYVEKFQEIDRQKIVQAAKASLRKKEGKKALDYLKNDRRLSDEIIEQFNFGYCPYNIDHQLKGRIITPIYNTYGNLVALSTRSLQIPKGGKSHFWHESFDKSLYLYGLCYARDKILMSRKAIIVEGEFDVATLHSNDFKMTIGVCGSSFSLIQAGLLSRYCSEVFVVFDGDDSGKKSIKRVMELVKKNRLESNLDECGMNYVPVYLPDGVDPDSYVLRKGSKGFRELLVNSRNKKVVIN